MELQMWFVSVYVCVCVHANIYIYRYYILYICVSIYACMYIKSTQVCVFQITGNSCIKTLTFDCIL